jgi:hypothetical protein
MGRIKIRGGKNGNVFDKPHKQKDPEYEFDGIIESEGVLEMMPDGYAFFTFLRLQLFIFS